MNPQLLANLQSRLPRDAVQLTWTQMGPKKGVKQFYAISGHLWLLNPSQEAPKWVGNHQETQLLAVGQGRPRPHPAP